MKYQSSSRVISSTNSQKIENSMIRVYIINQKGEKVLKNISKSTTPKIQRINHFNNNKIIDLVEKLIVIQNRRKSYTFQLFKQFILYENDQISSSLISISPYDKIRFDDEVIHTMVKIYETKEQENIIWAFLNIKFWRIYVKVSKFTNNIKKVTQKVQKKHLTEGMKHIKLYSIMWTPQKSETKSGLTRIASTSFIGYRKPGHIYQSKIKTITINPEQKYKKKNQKNQRITSTVELKIENNIPNHLYFTPHKQSTTSKNIHQNHICNCQPNQYQGFPQCFCQNYFINSKNTVCCGGCLPIHCHVMIPLYNYNHPIVFNCTKHKIDRVEYMSSLQRRYQDTHFRSSSLMNQFTR